MLRARVHACMCARVHECVYACVWKKKSGSLEARSMRQQTEAQRLLGLHHMQVSVGKQPNAVSGPAESQRGYTFPRAEVEFAHVEGI